MGFYTKQDKAALEKGKVNPDNAGTSGMARPKPGVSDVLAGEAGQFVDNLTPYIPMEMIGGSVPYVAGLEDEAVWNAAAQACGTEKVHYTYTIDEGRCWYIACPSSSFASNPDSWCPVAAALPGNSEYWDRETVYLYEQDGGAVAMRWEPETNRMQLYVGASRTILPRIQSMDANFVTVNTDMADIVPWRNRNLKSEQLSRAFARMLLITGIGVNLFIILLILVQYLLTATVDRNLEMVQEQARDASRSMMTEARDALQSDAIRHMVRVQQLLDTLKGISGTLVRYEVKGGSVEWEALIPQALVPETYNDMGSGRVKKSASIAALGNFELVQIDPKDGRVRIRGKR